MQHTDNGQKGEFFKADASGKRMAEISYIWRDDSTIDANHTWVDDSLQGQAYKHFTGRLTTKNRPEAVFIRQLGINDDGCANNPRFSTVQSQLPKRLLQ